ncbi:MAG TPA: VWA domain-containing protein [Thermoleophilaceae bacterium]|nr:VWA domain-containing protein [Thermoleophilaceae bacterium]
MASSPTVRLGLLAASMRAGGARLGVGELLAAHRALRAVDPSDPAQARDALRAALCSRREDLVLFDTAFAELVAPPKPAPPGAEMLDELGPLALPRAAVPGVAELPLDAELDPVPSAASEIELLREKDFAAYSDAERAVARRVLERLARHGPERPGRRLRHGRRRGSHPDLRRTVRASLRHDGEPFERHWRSPQERPRPLVLICDVSGSMEPYARVLLQYLQACVAARRRAEAFVFGTRLTRVTGELKGRDPDRALARASASVADWSGGTRIGDALAELNREYGRRVGRGAVVVVCSDGWDRGDPEQLGAEMARLRRCAHRLVWLNPLKAAPGYEPLARGMNAALPHVDLFIAGNTLASLERLAELMERGLEAR